MYISGKVPLGSSPPKKGYCIVHMPFKLLMSSYRYMCVSVSPYVVKICHDIEYSLPRGSQERLP